MRRSPLTSMALRKLKLHIRRECRDCQRFERKLAGCYGESAELDTGRVKPREQSDFHSALAVLDWGRSFALSTVAEG